MKNFLRHCIGVLLLCLPGQQLLAQHWLGPASDNYGGTNTLYQQPAQVADSRYRVYVNLAGFDAYMHNNYVRYDNDFSLLGYGLNIVPARDRDHRGRPIFGPQNLLIRTDGRNKFILGGAEIRGPSVMLGTRNERWGLAFTTRIRAGASFEDVSEPIAELIRNLLPKRPNLPAPHYDNQSANANINGMLELAATVGHVVHNDGHNVWKVGVTVKRLVGLYSVHANVKQANHELIADPDVDNYYQYPQLAIHSANIDYGFTNQSAYKSFRPSWLFGSGAAGSGWAADVGVVYEYRPRQFHYVYRGNDRSVDRATNKYKYRLSASLSDIGALRYNNPTFVSQYTIQSKEQRIGKTAFAGSKDVDGFLDKLGQNLGSVAEQKQTAFDVALPTALNLSADYNLDDNIYVNATLVQPFSALTTTGLRMPAVLAVTPRYESRLLTVSVPLSWQGNYHDLTYGLAVRVGPVFMGTDHIPGLFNFGTPKGMNLYGGVSIPIMYRTASNPTACDDPYRRRR